MWERSTFEVILGVKLGPRGARSAVLMTDLGFVGIRMRREFGKQGAVLLGGCKPAGHQTGCWPLPS